MSVPASIPMIFEWRAMKNRYEEHPEARQKRDQSDRIQRIDEPTFLVGKNPSIESEDRELGQHHREDE